MENRVSTQTPAAATEEAAATKNGGNATQEVSSTTQAVEPTKRSLRIQTWRKIKENKFTNRAIFSQIPIFVDNEKAAAVLAETEEFKKANDIKINIDRALYAAKLQTILAGKNLYLPGTRNSKALYLKVVVPADATEEQMRGILNIQSLEKHRTEISLENKVELDMVIIGSVVVSRDGYRIGRGNGFNDLDIGLLIEVGSITDKTVIATMVHDAQVVDNLPINLFQKYDTPVDLIITPTEVIRVAKRLPRPGGIFWELISERRLKIVPVLKEIKENLEKAGKIIVLKEVNTDVEQNKRNRFGRRFIRRRRFVNRRFQRRTFSQNNADQQGGDNNQQSRSPPRRRRFINRRRRPTKVDGDQSGADSKSQDRKTGSGGANRRPRPRNRRDFSVKLSNISRDVRVRDLKNELRSRQCNPIAITWKDQNSESRKRSLRVQMLEKLKESCLNDNESLEPTMENSVINCGDAATLLCETEEFKNAQNIKFGNGASMVLGQLKTKLAGKNVYLSSKRDSKALYLKAELPANATEEENIGINNVQNSEDHQTEISLENKVELDMVIISSLVISRDGLRIGYGNGFTDLSIGLHIEIGSISEKTVIATVVHDCQVVKKLPTNLFRTYDIPVDLIITPTEVIRVPERMHRPTGLYWELISERCLKTMPLLQEVKETQEKTGKVIVLKEQETDFNEHQIYDKQLDRKIPRRRRRQTKMGDDQSGGELKIQHKNFNRSNCDFIIKISEISRNVRVKDLKRELRNRQCTPRIINWKGRYGRCYLHYGNRNIKNSTYDDINNILQALKELSLNVEPAIATSVVDIPDNNNERRRQRSKAHIYPKLKVTLIKYNNGESRAELTNSKVSRAVNENCNKDLNAGGDESLVHVESVDTNIVQNVGGNKMF